MGEIVELPMAEFLAWTEPGDRDWSWKSQFDWLMDPANGRTEALRNTFWELRADGQQVPVDVGPDGRLWDGHHRVWCLVALGTPTIKVRFIYDD